MSIYYTLVVGAGLLACIQLFFIFIKKRSITFLYLALFVLAMLIPIWNMAVYHFSVVSLDLPALKGLFAKTPWLYGPLLWWHIISGTHSPHSQRYNWLHALPFAIQIALRAFNIPALDILSQGHLHFIALITHISTYILFGCWHLWQRKQLFYQQNATPLPSTFIYYFTLIVGLQFIMIWDFWVSGLAVFGYSPSLKRWDSLFLAEGLYVIALSLLSPTLSWQLNVNTRPKTSRLSKSAAATLAQELQNQMETQQWFMQPDMSLSRLAELIGISTHDVSEVLNQQLRLSFYDFVNQYRINLACQQLKKNTELSATDIGFACGFNSKTAFYNAFKKLKNTTPARYRSI